PDRHLHRRVAAHRVPHPCTAEELHHHRSYDLEGGLIMKITKTTHRLLALPAAVMVLALTTTGCSIVVEDGPQGQSSEQSTAAPATTEAATAEDEVEEPPVDDEAEASDGGGADTGAPRHSDAGRESEGEAPDPEVE